MNRRLFPILFAYLVLLPGSTVLAQGVKIGENPGAPSPSSILELESSSKGFLPPRMTQAERDNISMPEDGLVIFNTTSGCLNMFNDGGWRQSCFECDFGTVIAGNDSPVCEGNDVNLSVTIVPGATYSWTGPNGFTSDLASPVISAATPDESGSYSVVITRDGCSSSLVTAVNVLPIPVASITDNSPQCAGGTLQFNAPSENGVSYQWAGPNGYSSEEQNPAIENVQLENGGQYQLVMVYDETGCQSLTAFSEVSVNPVPDAPAASSNSPVCEGSNLQLTASSEQGSTYSWTGPNGFASSDQNPLLENAVIADGGIYSVTVTAEGCTSSPSSTEVVINESGSGGSSVFGYTGSVQYFVVPDCVYTLHVKAWGGGGGAYGSGRDGGGGGYAQTTLSVTPGETLSVVVGGGGQGVSASRKGSGGGGGSGIKRDNNVLIVAGGGGGNSNFGDSSGGAGGGLTGGYTNGGSGGTQSNAGSTGGSGNSPGQSGSGGNGGNGGGPNTGGNGGYGLGNGGNGGSFEGTGNGCGGGGGGGGYFGGGGGHGDSSGGGQTGGGGSSFMSGINSLTISGSNRFAGNDTDPDYADNAGAGGTNESNGNPGRIVINY